MLNIPGTIRREFKRGMFVNHLDRLVEFTSLNFSHFALVVGKTDIYMCVRHNKKSPLARGGERHIEREMPSRHHLQASACRPCPFRHLKFQTLLANVLGRGETRLVSVARYFQLSMSGRKRAREVKGCVDDFVKVSAFFAIEDFRVHPRADSIALLCGIRIVRQRKRIVANAWNLVRPRFRWTRIDTGQDEAV